MKLQEAKQLAGRIVDALRPMCERIEIAGSIRRGKPEVGDIDLVILPLRGMRQAIADRCRLRATPVIEGEQNCIYRLRLPDGREIQLDIFFARPALRDLFQTKPSNWGTLLLCRTGSKEHNIWIAERARSLGFMWKPYEGLFDEEGYCIAAAEEVEIFSALNLGWIPPELRERPKT